MIMFRVFLLIFALATSVWADAGWRGDPPSRAEQVKIWRLIKQIAKQEGVNPRLLASISLVESGDLNPRLRGADGEYGMMQVMPFQAKLRINGTPDELWDEKKQITAAARHLKEQNTLVSKPAIVRAASRHPVLRKHGLDNPRWLSCIGYNFGAIAVQLDRHGGKAKIPASSIRYALAVRKIYRKLK